MNDGVFQHSYMPSTVASDPGTGHDRDMYWKLSKVQEFLGWSNKRLQSWVITYMNLNIE